MFNQTLYVDIWTALYHLAIAGRNNEIAALVPELHAWHVMFKRYASPDSISEIGKASPQVIIVYHKITKCDLDDHHASYLQVELDNQKT